MNEKKMVSRNVAITLGIICIILIALIAYFTVTGISAQNSYNNLENQNNQLQTWLDGNETLLNQTQDDNTDLQNQVNSLNNTVNDLNRVLNFNETEHWNGGELRRYPPNSTDGWAGSASYAGYLEVDVNSNTTTTYVRVMYYSYYGVNYNSQIVVGAGNTRTNFPVLPAFEIEIIVGNTNLSDGALIGVTIIYHY